MDYWKLIPATKNQSVNSDADLLAKQQRMIEQF